MRKYLGIPNAILAFGIFIAAGAAPAQAQWNTRYGKQCTGKDAKAAIAGCTHVLKRRRLSVQNLHLALQYRGLAYDKIGDRDRAIQDLGEAIRLNTKNAAAYNNRAFVYNNRKDYDKAIDDLSEAIRLDPKMTSAYANRGFAYYEKKDFDRAIGDLDEVIRRDPKNASYFHRRGSAYNAKRDYDRAIRDFDEAIRLDPKFAVSYNNRGLAYYLKNDFDRAISDLDKAIRFNPKNVIAYGTRGSAYLRKGDYDRAIRNFEEALRINPKYAYAVNTRGLVYFKKRDFDRAKRDFDEALRLEPANAGHSNNRGAAYKELGDYDRAIADLNEAIRLNPKFARAYYHRGDAYRRKGDKERARSDLKRALELNPNEKDARAALAKLDAATPDTKVGKAEPAKSDTASPPPPVASVPTGPRIALVIGNGKYRFAPALPNPPNDARDISAALRQLGFKVIEGYDLDSAAMRAKIAEFGAAMPGAATTLFFYAGHGVQVAGKNYLVPVDAKLKRPSSLGVEAIQVGTILADMETEQRTNLVFLDACRDNPLARSLARSFGRTRSSTVGQGLAQLNAGIGTLITFATSPNDVALDGKGKHSPFTAALLKHIRTPNIEIRTMITRVRADVYQATHGKQMPWDHSSLLGEFYFKRGG